MDKSNIMPPGLHLMDCMEAMKQFPDKFFDIAIVDPPYGDASRTDTGGGTLYEKRPYNRFGQRFERYMTENSGGGYDGIDRTGGSWAQKYGKKIVAWDTAPGQEYFEELRRVSCHQIIWGGNYFDLPPTRCFLVWDKLTISESFTMAMCEYAWTSFFLNAKRWEGAPQGKKGEERFHPTQKPVGLYEWQLRLFARPGMKILDTHAGSGSLEVACHRAGLDCWGFEINEEYYRKACKRLEDEKAQLRFDV